MPNHTLQILEQGLSDGIKEILVEAPYVDKDFRDTYYNDFSKRFMHLSRDSVRMHFFSEKDQISQESYLGFVTLRDTKVHTIGRSYLNPKAIKGNKRGYFCLASFKVQVKGVELVIDAYPWMQQDGNVSRCAHVAAWSVNRYFSQKKSRYPERFLHEITEHDTATRKIPSNGATVEQIAQVLTNGKFAPEIHFRGIGEHGTSENKSGDFDRLIYTYIESGIPCVAGLIKKQHAVSIVGHGPIENFDEVINENEGIIDSYNFFSEIILSNDNHLPYTSAYNYENADQIQFSDIEVLIVPFNDKMYLDAGRLYSKILPIFEKNALKLNRDKLIRRVFLTSSNSYKSFIKQHSKDEEYLKSQLQMRMPKFIWISEYSSIDEYKNEMIRHRIVFDATMLNFHDSVFLSIKKSDQLILNQNDSPKAYLLNSKSEKMYKNNLTEVVT